MNNSTTYHSRQGSVLVIAIIFTLVISIFLGTYLQMATTDLKLSTNGYRYSVLINFAEQGADEAFWAFNNDDWTGWTQHGNAMYREIGQQGIGDRSTNVWAEITVFVEDFDDEPTLYIEARAVSPNKTDLIKQIKMRLGNSSPFRMGMTAKDKLKFSGGTAKLDSFDSADGPWDELTNKGDKGTVGSVSPDNGAVELANAEVYGFLATGGGNPTYGSNGKVYGEDSPPAPPNIDESRVSKDFSATFPDPVAPTDAELIADGYTLFTALPPRVGATVTIGGVGKQAYHMRNINMSGNFKNLNINGEVIIILDDPALAGDGNLTMSGQAKMTLDSNFGKATFYIYNDITIAGNGIANETTQPTNLVIYGTRTSSSSTGSSQDVVIGGNGNFTGVIYAPNADLTLNGGGMNGGISGAVIANDIAVNGNVDFHYDEQLESFLGNTGGIQLKEWHEITSAADYFDFDQLIASATSIP